MFNSVVVGADSTAYILIPPGDGGLFAFNPNGTIKFTFNLDYFSRTRTFALDKSGLFYFIDDNSTLNVIDQQGNIQWILQDDRFYSFSTFITFSPEGDVIYIISWAVKLLAFDINTRQIQDGH